MSLRFSASRCIVIAALGFFALVAQTLLFRDFLTVFEGNELGISAFFTTWLLWIAVGALAARADTPVHRAVTQAFPYFTLLFIPAFVLQHTIILQSRALIGVEAYELFPFAPMIGMAFLANAPVCFLTGFLFARACPWAIEASALPVARVYVLETLGSCLGAIASTLLLAIGIPAESVFLCAACLLLASVAMALRGVALRSGLIALVIVLALFQGRMGREWADLNATDEWGRLLPKDAYRGHFTTAQARYLYGERESQFIAITSGGVCEALPPAEHEAEVAALNLAQKPDARDVLVFGESSLGICTQFKSIPQVRTVTWLHPDPRYAKTLIELPTVAHMLKDIPIEIPGTDIRDFIFSTPDRYDLIVLNLQDATTLVRNRYCSVEFFQSLKDRLRPGGVVSARVSGGANFMGSELAILNASMLTTLGAVFHHTAIKPGDETWVLASDGDGLSELPGVLRDRYAAIPGAPAMYPSQGILTLYPPDRIAFQRRVCQETVTKYGDAFLRNTDLFPKAPFFSLLLALKQTGWGSLAGMALILYGIGIIVFVYPPLLYALLRGVYLVKSRRRVPRGAGGMRSVFDAHALMFSTGFVGMAASILFLFVYQVRYGSLFLDIGLLTALFMLGSFLGGALSERLLVRNRHFDRILMVCLLIQVALLTLSVFHQSILSSLPATAARLACSVPFLFCGVFTGVYFPIAAKWMDRAGRSVTAAGSNLEMIDNLGGAAGALIAGLGMLPLLGSTTPLLILALFVTINFVPLFLRGARMPSGGDRFARVMRPIAYLVFVIAAFALLLSHHAMLARARIEGNQLGAMARDMVVDEKRLHEEHAQGETGVASPYVRVDPSDTAPAGYVFETQDWGPRVYGYGGIIDLAAYVDASGALIDFRLMRSHETPAYVAMLRDWKSRLLGRNLFAPDAFKGVDAVSGATITSNAITKALDVSGRGFATRALGKKIATANQPFPEPQLDWRNPSVREFLCLALLTLSALTLRFRPRTWPRRVVLLATVAIGGFWLNLQYSSQHVMSLLGLNIGSVSVSGSFFLVVLVPIIVMLFGNAYCGYVCPFGALQELAGDLFGRRMAISPEKRVWRYARSVKYFLLFMLVMFYAFTRDYSILEADPLIMVFTLRDWTILGIGAACVILSIFFRRFWCRNLCPAGAFLSLLNGVYAFRRWMPVRRPLRCDMGVETMYDLDCLHCDRCLLPSRTAETSSQELRAKSHVVLLGAVAAAALVILGLTVSHMSTFLATQSVSTQVGGAGGKSRNVDIEKIREMIRRHQLSEHPAEFSAPAPEMSPNP